MRVAQLDDATVTSFLRLQLLVRVADLLHLARVTLGMFCQTFDDLEQAEQAPLGVIARALERLGWQVLEQIVILGAHAAEGLERLLGLPPMVVQPDGPGILVVGDDGRVVLSDHLAHAVRVHHFGVGHVGHDLPDAPFARRHREIFLLAKDAGEDYGEQFRSATKALEERGKTRAGGCHAPIIMDVIL